MSAIVAEAQVGGDLGAQYEVPVVSVRLVREGTATTEVQRVRNAGDVFGILGRHFAGLDRESFVVLLLDTQNQIRAVNTVTVGTLDASLVHPREVFKPALVMGAASIILAHNHPSGDPTPSAEDRTATRQLVEAGRIVGIEVLDHVVVGEGRYLSFAEAGLMVHSA